MQKLTPRLTTPMSRLDDTCQRFLSESTLWFDNKRYHTKHLDGTSYHLRQLQDTRARLEEVVSICDGIAANVSPASSCWSP